VVRGVVLKQIHPMAAAVKVRQQVTVHERQISLRVEVFGLVVPDKVTRRHTDRPQDFWRVALAARGNFRLLAAPAQVRYSVGVCRKDASSS